MCPPDGDWQLQVPPGAPGTARQGPTRIIMLVNHGGTATQPRAPGHERPHAALRAARHGRLSAASTAPGADVPPATTAEAPGQHRLRAMAIATVALPAGQPRLRQESLPHTPANPRILTYSYSHHTVSSLRRKPQSSPRPAARRYADSPSLPGKGPGVRSASFPTPPPLHMVERGPGGEARPITHQVHPAIQVPPYPRSCSTAATGRLRQHPSRAPPTASSSRLTPQSTHLAANLVGASLVGAQPLPHHSPSL